MCEGHFKLGISSITVRVSFFPNGAFWLMLVMLKTCLQWINVQCSAHMFLCIKIDVANQQLSVVSKCLALYFWLHKAQTHP